MADKKEKAFPRTQHSKICDRDGKKRNDYVVLDSPDDRITGQDGDGLTLVADDNPDDSEDKLD